MVDGVRKQVVDMWLTLSGGCMVDGWMDGWQGGGGGGRGGG